MLVPDPPANHLEPVYVNDRGFKGLPEIPGSYGGHSRVFESSAAEHPHIWLAVTEPTDLNRHGICMATDMRDCRCEFRDASLHLSIENAAALRDQLTFLVENHYQMS